MGKPTKLPRKERRRQQRLLKKAKKNAFFSKRQVSDRELLKEVIKKPTKQPEKLAKPKVQKPVKKKQLVNPGEIRKKQLLEANKMEDRNIKQLEKKLKLNRRKSKSIPKSFIDDGLDYILEACDEDRLKGLQPQLDENDSNKLSTLLKNEDLSSEQSVSDDEDIDMTDDNEDGLENMENKDGDETDASAQDISVDSTPKVVSPSNKQKHTSKRKQDVSEAEEQDEPNISKKQKQTSKNFEELTKPLTEESSDSSNKKQKQVHWDLEDDEDCSEHDESDEGEESKPTTWEDIYGRLRDQDGKVVKDEAKYIPPAKRQITNSLSESLSRLKKKLQGLMNRLSETNIHPISMQMEELYRNHSRNDMNETICSLLSEAIIQPALTPERLVQEHAMLVASLHANVGTEIGAHVLQRMVETFHDLHLKAPDEGKEMHNALLLICHMYSFKVVGCTLVCNILKLLTDRFTDLDIELILLILKSIGFQLRKDNPINLKEMIFNIQAKATKASDSEGSRVKFMLETLMAIRNNNMNKIPNFDPSHIEHLKKLLRGIIRKGCSITELNIPLKDLLEADKKGRWWIVGSAWQDSPQNDDENSDRSTLNIVDTVDEKILNLARQQRMNTDIRRSIFCVLMTAEDYMDCFEKLLKLSLKNQEREIVIVILDCCMNEKQFNPYYAHLAEKFCSLNRKFQIAFQFAVWDRFKELKSMKNSQVTNFANFLGHLLITHSLSLSVLKVLHFGQMDTTLVKFLRQLLLVVLLHEDEKAVCNAFARIYNSKKLLLLRKSIQLFVHHFLLQEHEGIPEESVEILKGRVQKIDFLTS